MHYIKFWNWGGDIGLHFDETQYTYQKNNIEYYVAKEKQILEMAIEKNVNTISMHIPSHKTLESDYQFDGLINSYSKEFFKKYKYVSDSNMNWREDVFDIINSNMYEKLHILTHPIWYSQSKESKNHKIEDYLKQKKLLLEEEIEIIVPDMNKKENK